MSSGMASGIAEDAASGIAEDAPRNDDVEESSGASRVERERPSDGVVKRSTRRKEALMILETRDVGRAYGSTYVVAECVPRTSKMVSATVRPEDDRCKLRTSPAGTQFTTENIYVVPGDLLSAPKNVGRRERGRTTDCSWFHRSFARPRSRRACVRQHKRSKSSRP